MQKEAKQAARERAQDRAKLVHLGTHGTVNPGSMAYAGSHASIGIDNKFDLKQFKKNFKITILEEKQTEDSHSLVFEMTGIDVSLANAFRRILIEEVPTMAIETVFILNNTSIIPDEVLSHRLGLIPIRADPRLFVFKKEGEENADNNTLVFKLDVACTKKRDAVAGETNPDKLFRNHKVYSGDLVWDPQGDQATTFADAPIAPVLSNILLAKLRPPQAIEVEVHCVKGIGKTHAKWSPVATASYRLMPAISFRKPVRGSEAEALKKACPMKVFDIEDSVAVVKRPLDCTMCRECIRTDLNQPWTDRLDLARVKDSFIFSIESTGILPPDVLLQEAVTILMKKCSIVSDVLEA